jgi:hypothetical protein
MTDLRVQVFLIGQRTVEEHAEDNPANLDPTLKTVRPPCMHPQYVRDQHSATGNTVVHVLAKLF